MSAASVLSSFSPSSMPGPVMPMDVAMRFYLSHSPPPLRGFLSSYEDLQRAKTRRPPARRPPALYKPLRPCLSAAAEQQDVAPPSGGQKKRVVFADSRGLALTAIHLFSPGDDEAGRLAPPPLATPPRDEEAEPLQFELEAAAAAARRPSGGGERRLALDFPAPAGDYLGFRRRLAADGVCLESVALQGRSLTGTVRVRNLGYEKRVAVRVTFDGWRSFRDVACSYMNNVYGGGDSDAFAFELELPAALPDARRVQFCLRFQAAGALYWDNNGGRNYGLRQEGGGQDPNQNQNQDQDLNPDLNPDLDLDRFGSPRLSSGFFPGWQSWSHTDTAVPYW